MSGITLVRRVSELLEEREQRVEQAGSWDRTDWEWRCHWNRRMGVLTEELRSCRVRGSQAAGVLAGMESVERERQAATG